MSTQNYDKHSEEQSNQYAQPEPYNAEQARKYEEQSNLYDPKNRVDRHLRGRLIKENDPDAKQERDKDDPDANRARQPEGEKYIEEKQQQVDQPPHLG